MAKRKQETDSLDLEIAGMPTARGLIRTGQARMQSYRSGGERIKVSDEGHAMLGEALRRKAEANLAAGKGDWTRPPSSGKERR